MGCLQQDTELSGESGRYTARLSRDWEIWGPNGGYLAAIVLRAAGKVARIPRPASLHVHYLRPARSESVSVDVEVLQAGRAAESISVRMTQGDKLILSALVRTAAVGPGVEHESLAAPEVSPPALACDIESLRTQEHPRYPYWDNFERRVLQPEFWAQPRVARPPRWLEWFRYRSPVSREDVFLEAARAVLLIDTLCWPAAWLHHVDERFIAPSLDLTIWFHAVAAGEWLLADSRSDIARAGLVGGFCQVWDEERNLVASGGSQLLCTPAPTS